MQVFQRDATVVVNRGVGLGELQGLVVALQRLVKTAQLLQGSAPVAQNLKIGGVLAQCQVVMQQGIFKVMLRVKRQRGVKVRHGWSV